jgi:hypothetical protein
MTDSCKKIIRKPDGKMDKPCGQAAARWFLKESPIRPGTTLIISRCPVHADPVPTMAVEVTRDEAWIADLLRE